ncbi:MAG: hypothetical protein R2710_15585 [Acidimicrobiales bacterium]
MLAALAGFLWFNAAPAEIFMGDTGSLAIGTGLAALALTTNTHLLLPIIGGIYVAETTSVMLQVAYFKATKASACSAWRRFIIARAPRLEGDEGDHPLLADRHRPHRRRPRVVLYRLGPSR